MVHQGPRVGIISHHQHLTELFGHDERRFNVGRTDQDC